MTEQRKWWEFDSAMLHILAMVLMLSDHTWSALLPGQAWMTCIGRIAFPIFAFMIAEGYRHTRDWKKYAKRMLLFALISEIPFNYMVNGTWRYPFHQNVMWTFFIALLGMKAMDTIRAKGKRWLSIAGCTGIVILCTVLGFACFVDYYGTGILMVFAFYFFPGKKWWDYLGQFAIMYYLNVEVLGGFYYDVTVFGIHMELVQQAFALLALIPIWLYRGRQGYHSKGFQYFCYAFYPVHMLLLVIIGYLTR